MALNYKIRAVSLVSLLVGLAIGSFILVVMLQVFSGSKANYKLVQNLDEMSSVLRYAQLTMTDIIKQAGYAEPIGGYGSSSYGTWAWGGYPAGTPASYSYTITAPGGGTYDQKQAFANNPAGIIAQNFPALSTYLGSGTEDKFWVKFAGSVNGRIRHCYDLYGNNTTSMMVRFYSRQWTRSGSTVTGYYCENQFQGSNLTYTETAQSGVEIIPPDLFDTAWVRFGEQRNWGVWIDRWSSELTYRYTAHAVKVAFLIRSRDELRDQNTTQTFYVFGNTVTRNTKRIYKMVQFTVLLPYSWDNQLFSSLNSKVVFPVYNGQ